CARDPVVAHFDYW
nr:immunoglobulin heavy chain junction region [Mus musculus]